MIKLQSIEYSMSGKRVDYDYSIPIALTYLLNEDEKLYIEFEEDISHLPYCINVIPFLASFMPIVWFYDLEIHVDEIDERFLNCLKCLKEQFQNEWPEAKLKGNLKYNKVVTNELLKSNNSLMLYSGGVDANATLIRHLNKYPELVTILGADVPIQDAEQWSSVKKHISNEKLTKKLPLNLIKTNIRDFYTNKISDVIKGEWWGKIQHGMSLIGSCAPLAFKRNISNIIIASSYTKDINISWGSSPYLDEKISWASTEVIHDGYELKRQDKVDLIARYVASQDFELKLRVCYSELNHGLNCSNCEKCFRTIIGLILSGVNPNEYGFSVNSKIYNKTFNYLNNCNTSNGMNYFWSEISQKAKSSENHFIFENKTIENHQIQKIASGYIDSKLDKILNETKFESFVRRLPHRLINKIKRAIKK